MILLLLAGLFVGCSQTGQSDAEDKAQKKTYEFQTPEWSKDMNIYEVNVRQYTAEGTFKAFESHLPRLNNMGVDILWFMPIHPIGVKNRKGTLGSYYSIMDYKAVNPEFGTLDDFKSVVTTAHNMGFKVIIDWVANHSAWDNAWVKSNPEWYTVDSTGQMVSPYDWTDVADLNYDDKALWDAMIDALKYWVVEADIDGYRCDVAGMVPVEFWEKARYELDQIKPVFMLAEAEEAIHHEKSFDMSYAWELHHIFNQIAKGNMNADHLENYFAKHDTVFPPEAYRMAFITNHDENSWNGTIAERMGSGAGAFAVLSYTLPGMPLIYSGQETGLNKRLEFFEKDEIEWDPQSPIINFYSKLNALKKSHKSLWNGIYGGTMTRVKTPAGEKAFCFVRELENDIVLVITNLSAVELDLELKGKNIPGEYTDYFSGEVITLVENESMTVPSGGYKVLIRN